MGSGRFWNLRLTMVKARCRYRLSPTERKFPTSILSSWSRCSRRRGLYAVFEVPRAVISLRKSRRKLNSARSSVPSKGRRITLTAKSTQGSAKDVMTVSSVSSGPSLPRIHPICSMPWLCRTCWTCQQGRKNSDQVRNPLLTDQAGGRRKLYERGKTEGAAACVSYGYAACCDHGALCCADNTTNQRLWVMLSYLPKKNNMQKTFGNEYLNNKKQVRSWI